MEPTTLEYIMQFFVGMLLLNSVPHLAAGLQGRTFPSPLPRRALDFVFLPEGCADVRCEVVSSLLSDHLPVSVEFSF